MQFLRTLFWVVLAVVAVIFAVNNWSQVTINLWGGLQADAKLPVLLLGAFLIGLVPMYLLHRATRWSLRRRLDSAERSLAELRAIDAPAPVPAPATAPSLVGDSIAPVAMPTAYSPPPAPAVIG
jgi:putative membrane protein